MVKIYSLALAAFFIGLIPVFAHASTISITPVTGSFSVGDRVTTKIVVTGQAPINAATVTVVFPTSIFSIESISKADSILNFWVTEPTFSKSSGVVSLEGVALGGFSGTSGTLLTVRLKAIKAGSGGASFQSGQVFANDGQGTDVTSGLVGATFSVQPAPVIPPSPPPAPVTPPAPKELPPEEFILELPQPLPTLTAPEIMLGAKYGEPAIVGTSQYPNADVLVTFVAQDGAKIFISNTADANGGFTVLVPTSLKRGSYTVTAVMVQSDKTNSKTSNEITVAVGSIWSDLGPKGIAIISLVLLLIGFLSWRAFHVVRMRRNPALAKEVKEAKTAVRKSFDELREDLYDYEIKNAARGKPTVDERIQASHLKKDLDAAERSISREIDDIK